MMIWELFSRLLLTISSFSPSEIDPSGLSPEVAILPGNLSFLLPWTNDTITIDNPYYQYGHEDDDGTSFHQHALITLPICCSSIDPERDNGVASLCPTSKDGAAKQETSNLGESVLDFGAGRWYPSSHLFPTENRSHYKFEVRNPSCSRGLSVVKLSMDEFEVGRIQGRFLRNGYFGYNNDEFYSPQEYCISGLTGEFVQVMICDSQDCSLSGDRPCIQKCCNPDEIYSFSRRSCIKSKGALFRPIFYHDLSTQLSDSEQEAVLPHYHIVFPRSFKYNCIENRTQIFPAGAEFARLLSNFTNRKYHSAHFKIRKDGQIMYRRGWKAIVHREGEPPEYVPEGSRKCYTLQSMSHYCIDGAAEYGNSNPFNNDPGEIFFVTCSEYLFGKPEIGPLSFVYGNVMITSSLFSLLTVLVYMALREKQNIHGWTIASYAFSMFLMYIFLGLAHLIRYYQSDGVLKTGSCVIIGIASHLFSLSSFLWLTLMNWDIWWTFRKFRPSPQNGNVRRGRELRHFLTYSGFGWGLPIVITGISTFLHFKYEEASEDDCAVVGVPLPAYGRESCEIKQKSLGEYLYYPAALLLGSNLVFFSITVYTLCRHNWENKLATKSLERHHQSVQLFAKLFFVMGVTRVFEVITWAGGSGPTLTWYWAVFDMFNVLQAVAIFIIYVCKRDVLQSLKKLFSTYFYGQKGNGGRAGGRGPLHQRESHTIRVSSCSQQSQLSMSSRTTLNTVIDASGSGAAIPLIIPAPSSPSPSPSPKSGRAS